MMIKKFYFTFFATLLLFAAAAQSFQMTIIPGSQPNSVKAVIRAGSAIDGQVSSAQITFIVPTSVGARPTASIVNNPITGVSYVLNTSTEVLSDGTYYVWEFDGVGNASVPNISFGGGSPFELLEVKFEGGTSVPSQVRVAQLPNGGVSGTSPGNYNFYLSLSGNDAVNQAAQFYGSIFNNDGLGYAGYSYAALNGVLLPVQFTAFTVVAKNTDALLSWSVANENAQTNVYEIERSLDGSHFERIASVPALRVGNGTITYQFTDLSILQRNPSKTIYYRIKQVDLDLRFTYTSTKWVKSAIKNLWANVYPNPANAQSKINIFSKQQQDATIRISNADGKVISVQQRSLVEGNNNFQLLLNGYPSGYYHITIYSGHETITIPVVWKP